MGNSGSARVAESAAQAKKIQFDKIEMRMIYNPFEGYKGWLIEQSGRNGEGTGNVVVTKRLTPSNKHKVLVRVYTYTCTCNPPVDGTYVVLQFEQSQKYFAAHKNKPDRLILKKGGWDPEDAEDITTTADRRVFLMMKPTDDGVSRERLFASRGDSRYVITVFQNPRKVAELEDQGTGSAIEAQLFQLEYQVLRRAQGSSELTVDALEVVPA